MNKHAIAIKGFRKRVGTYNKVSIFHWKQTLGRSMSLETGKIEVSLVQLALEVSWKQS